MNSKTNGIFTQNFIDHFTNPRNIGEIKNADGFAKVGDPSCGDFIKVWIKVESEIITDYKYKVFGCGGAIATTSVASELAIGKSIKAAIQLTDDDVIQKLGGLPENKAHCSLLGINGLRTAIADFLIKDNHKKYAERINTYKQAGYDIPKHRKALVQFLNVVPKQAKILDIGTGKGHLALAIAQAGWSVTSVDLSDSELYFARLNAVYFQLDEKIELLTMDAKNLNVPEHSFDVVMCADLMHHLPQPDAVLSEMIRVCKPIGRILISDLNENGQKILKNLLKQEGKEHVLMGWEMKDIQKWFEEKGLSVEFVEKECENFLIARLD